MENAARPLPVSPPEQPSGQAPYGLRHVAIIMDGNGRWAQKRGLPRTLGHHAGVEALRRVVRHVGDIGIPFLTIYSFSAENWSRPASEVADLMGLLKRFIRNDLADLHARNVRVRIIGDRNGLSADIRSLLDDAERMTAANAALTLVVAFNYGARQELIAAARSLAEDVSAGRLDPGQITAEAISTRLTTHGIPDPDLIIRTSGEQRLSNFLLWQAAYAELVFTPTLWPDFDGKAFDEALRDYAGRNRRFGGL